MTRYQPENALEILTELAGRNPSDMYLFPDDIFGSELSVRLACRMAGSSLTAARHMHVSEDGILCLKNVYASHIEGTFLLRRKPYFITAAKGCADTVPFSQVSHHLIDETDGTHTAADGFVESFELEDEESDHGLEEARFLITAGRGCKNRAVVEKIAAIADKMGASFGVSRPAAMSAWAPMDRLIGVSGAMTKPEICITGGSSGSAAFLAGIEKSKFILSVNTDPSAAISKCADVSIIDDGEKVMEEILKQFEKEARGT
jgi:electron transfer flavoprotein alpha subunit